MAEGAVDRDGSVIKCSTVKEAVEETLGYDTRVSITPLSETSQRLLKSPRKPPRKINKNPYKVLDAPDLTDDFYLNLVDWSALNTLAVGLGHCVYLWNAQNSQASRRRRC